ncbi:glutathione-regulated potassium-efflux system ancillary protein KefF [Rhodoferax ferrireducens]|uniref:Glutathione-regulated potassium-efflux system ancillary protein KefF n=1 Tax=Rhodoferax ferrireducens TaxID=192843 RepID=A0ABU2CD04_9BURK|nr:NAD(P)H-dependent oxidoreductase [Rhodoferax ferrireducens]MDR7379222.1 glutathione-regulated potassium-efflux system ancillary protein KefF [Rhodoferax ferrireducens]
MHDPSPPTPSPTSPPRIYLLAAHPNWRASLVNQRLLAAARALTASADGPQIEVQDLYANYPDYDIDVAAEQARVEAADLLVLLHPIQWYAMPALQKLWFDEVLTYGWAYGAVSAEGLDVAPAGTPGTALRGKALWLVLTTGGQEGSYQPGNDHRHPFDNFLPPYEQTAALCGMRFLPPLVLHAAHSAGKQEVTTHIDSFRQRLQSYPHWPELNT